MKARNTLLELTTDAFVDCRDMFYHTVERSVLKMEKERGLSLVSEKPIGMVCRRGLSPISYVVTNDEARDHGVCGTGRT
jgi:hypothetical protein